MSDCWAPWEQFISLKEMGDPKITFDVRKQQSNKCSE